MKKVYHFSSSMCLPWIIEAGELRPHREHDVGIGITKHLWCTSDPQGDLTASPFRRIHSPPFGDERVWRSGRFFLVRFTLSPRDVMTWEEVKQKSKWTSAQVAELMEDDRKRFGVVGHDDKWFLRRKPLPLSRVLRTEITSYLTQRWSPIELSPAMVVNTDDPTIKGIRIGNSIYYAKRSYAAKRSRLRYEIWPPAYEPDWAEMAADARAIADTDDEDDEDLLW